MHRVPGVVVAQNVRLPVIGDATRTSEIDVVLNATVAGYPVQIAFECKNERQVVGTPKINLFLGKLEDVGIPPQQAVFVSIKGFTRGAVARARKAGMRTLVLTGLTEDRLASVIEEAFQAVIHLWLVVTQVWIVNSVSQIDGPEQLGVFYDQNGNIVGYLADLIWRKWFEGDIPNTAGEHPVVLQLPVGWRNIIRHETSIPDRISATVKVHAVVTILTGTANRHTLVDATTGDTEKLHVTTSFTRQAAQIRVFKSEDELQRQLEASSSAVVLKTRSRLPRIQWFGGVLWPPGATVNARFREEMAKGADPATINIRELETPSFAAMWDIVWHSPMLQSVLKARFS